MDVGDSTEEAQKLRRRVFLRPRAGPRSRPRNPERHGGSKLRRPARGVIAESPLRHAIELARNNISLELPIPRFGVECREPLTKCSQFLGVESLNLSFNPFHSAHKVLFYYISAGQLAAWHA